jgi:hypothetical protein
VKARSRTDPRAAGQAQNLIVHQRAVVVHQALNHIGLQAGVLHPDQPIVHEAADPVRDQAQGRAVPDQEEAEAVEDRAVKAAGKY